MSRTLNAPRRQKNGQRRCANLIHLYERARQFGTFSRQGLYRFIRFLESLSAETDPPLCFINPEVIFTSDEQQDSEEGCLSFPDIYVKVKRPMRAKVRATDIEGKIFEAEGEALMARCLLHEFDHLTGKLLVDFVGPLKRQMIKKKLQKVKDAEAEAEA